VGYQSRRTTSNSQRGTGWIRCHVAHGALSHPSLVHGGMQAIILAMTAVSLFATAQFTREATNESHAQFAPRPGAARAGVFAGPGPEA
jgi:hypothetical protein